MTTSATPILDRIEPLPPVAEVTDNTQNTRSRSRLWDIFILASLALGTLLWICFQISPSPRMPRILRGRLSEGLYLFWLICILPFLGCCYAVIVHECGHLLAGFCMRFQLVSVRMGPLQFHRQSGLALAGESEPGIRGWVKMLPGTPTAIHLRMAAFILGGPMANLACAVAVPLFTGDSMLAASFVLFSYLLGIGNLVPSRVGAVNSDGKNLLTLFRRVTEMKRVIAIRQLATDLRNGVAPKDLNLEWIAMATAICDDSLATMLAYLFAYESAWHTSTVEETARLLETALQHAKHASPALRENLHCNAAVFQARKRGRADQAQQWLTDLLHLNTSSEHRLHIEAGILETQGDVDGALAKLDEAIKAKLAQPSSPPRDVGVRSLERWRDEVRVKMTKSSAAQV